MPEDKSFIYKTENTAEVFVNETFVSLSGHKTSYGP